jgi:hypothetical protein
MQSSLLNTERPDPGFLSAASFWERGRLPYNGVLAAVVVAWLVFTWPHFRASLTLGSLVAFVVLGLGANFCYSAAYLADIAIQLFAPKALWRGFRRTLWVAGMLIALVVENYWIADEIYPYADQPPHLFGGTNAMWTANIASNMNFPAPLAAVGFLAACLGLFLALASVLIFWFARKPRLARAAVMVIGAGGLIYLALLLGFSAASHERVMRRGEEKYFCEIDCHLAYSIVDVKTQTDAMSSHSVIAVRTRFDETTTSPSRPKDAPLTPSPREVRLIDGAGREYVPVSTAGPSLMTPLKPAETYTTQVEFQLPKNATGLRLLINTVPGWPDRVVIGDENSWLHKKTYLAL